MKIIVDLISENLDYIIRLMVLSSIPANIRAVMGLLLLYLHLPV